MYWVPSLFQDVEIQQKTNNDTPGRDHKDYLFQPKSNLVMKLRHREETQFP